MRYRLTDSFVRDQEPPPHGNKIYYDKDEKARGFGFRVTAQGARSFVLSYRVRATGQERRYTIGAFPVWTTAKARAEAKDLRRQIDAGFDPLKALEADRKADEAERAAPTVADLAERYKSDHLPKKKLRSRIEDERLLEKIIVPELGRSKVAEVSFTQVDALHRKVTKERGPFRANRVIALLSKIFSLSIKWKMRRDNPCVGIEKNPEPKRQRFLSDAELERAMAVLDADSDQQAAGVVRLLLLTGARSAEVLGAEWGQFDLKAGVWVKPHTMTKTKEDHHLPLSAEAVALLKRIKAKARGGKFVFPDGDNAFKPRKSVRHAWDRVCEAAKLDGVRIHDLRHTHASLLANAGFNLLTIGGMLGHKTPSTTMRYVHLVDATLRKAADSVGARVIPLKERA